MAYIESILASKAINVAVTLLFLLIDVVAVVLLCVSKKHFYIPRAGLNPFKNIYRMLKYTWKHKVSEHRSAFTY